MRSQRRSSDMRSRWALLALVGIVIAPPAMAAPNFLGPTGLLLIPTADVVGNREWNVHAHFIDRDSTSTFGANVGLIQNLEVGVTGLHSSGSSTIGILNGKYRLVPETAKA